MQRIHIEQLQHYPFKAIIPIRITDVNYGSHVGNDAFLALLHEARVQYLASIGLSELKFGEQGLIMSNAAVEFRAEMFYGDVVEIEVAASHFTSISFDLVYRMWYVRSGETKLAGLAKTGMVCFDYEKRKPALIQEEILHRLQKQ